MHLQGFTDLGVVRGDGARGHQGLPRDLNGQILPPKIKPLGSPCTISLTRATTFFFPLNPGFGSNLFMPANQQLLSLKL